MIKLVALDLDHTLLGEDRLISGRNKAAIAEALELGIKVVLCTGRMFRASERFARELNLSGPLICYNGALAKELASGETLFHQPLALELAKQLLRFAQDERLHVNFYYQDRLYFERWTEEAKFYTSQSQVPGEAVGDLLAFLPGPPTKLLFVMEPDRVQSMWRSLREEFAGKLNVTVSESRYLEFLAPRVNKGRALAALGERLGIEAAEVMAIGDSFNDLELIRAAGLGVAMANAPQAVKAEADFVTQSNGEDGVAGAIEKFILKEEGNAR